MMIPRRKLAASFLAMLIVMSLWPRISEGQGAREKIVLIFCDVTSSLDEGERNAVIELTSRLIQNLKPPVRYQVLPIMLETERARPLLNEKIPSLVKPSDKARYQQALSGIPAYLKQEISTLYAQTNSPGADPNRSCIISSLERAGGIFEQYRTQKNVDLYLFIVSDMLEECERNPYEVPIRLNKTNIKNEIETVKKKVIRVGKLAGVQVAMVVPAGRAYTSSYGHPPLRSLGEFWRTVFRQAGFGGAQLSDPEKFYFGSGLPERFQRPW
jgi:hypothetical protein